MVTLTPLNPASPARLDRLDGRLRRRGTILSYSDFNTGTLEGWAPDHFGYATPKGSAGLTRNVPYSGSHAMMISTPETAYGVAATYEGAAYKRNGWPGPVAPVSFSAMFALAGDNDPNLDKRPWANFGLGVDTQYPDDSQRYFFRALYSSSSDAWLLRTSSSWATVPASAGKYWGMNEWKRNYFYVRLTVDPATGRYIELQVMDQLFDLVGVADSPTDLLLTDTGSWDHFRGGLNAGVFLSRHATNPSTHNIMLVDEAFMSYNDRIAA